MIQIDWRPPAARRCLNNGTPRSIVVASENLMQRRIVWNSLVVGWNQRPATNRSPGPWFDTPKV